MRRAAASGMMVAAAPADVRIASERARAWGCLARCQIEGRRFAEGLVTARRTCELKEYLAALDPHNLHRRLALAAARQFVVRALIALERWDEALVACDHLLAIHAEMERLIPHQRH